MVSTGYSHLAKKASAKMTDPELKVLNVGAGDDARDIAVLRRPGHGPGLIWLGGFKSDMAGSKAEALDLWAEEYGYGCTRFDYSGHGRSGGAFLDGSISRWLEETLAVIRTFTSGPSILIGSSMGGWISLLAAAALKKADEADRLAGMVLIAPAYDMTEDLMWDRFDEKARTELQETGAFSRPSDYSDEPYILTRLLIEDGRNHLVGAGPVETGCGVHILQGMQDPDVPWRHATGLMERLAHDDAVLTLIADGDHRLSRPADIDRLISAVEGLIAGYGANPA
jgi:pimeloyl-ACP methyl ester carboxylesterase